MTSFTDLRVYVMMWVQNFRVLKDTVGMYLHYIHTCTYLCSVFVLVFTMLFSYVVDKYHVSQMEAGILVFFQHLRPSV